MTHLLVVSLLAGLTAANGSSCGQPKHIHLAVGKHPSNSMTVSFSSEPCESSDSMVPTGAVVFGASPERMENIAVAQTPAFRDKFLMFPHHDGRLRGNYTSGYYHHVRLDNLKPNEEYFYQCVVFWGALEEQSIAINGGEGQETEDSGRSLRRTISKHHTSHHANVSSFWTAPTPGAPARKRGNVEGILKLAILGDLGFSKRAKGTMARISSQISDISAVILAGDIAYTGGNPENWDAWFDVIDTFPAFSHLPVQIAAGNHDIEIRPNGDIFTEYEKRFFMPQVREVEMKPYVSSSPPVDMMAFVPPYPLEYDYGNSYYSFIYGVSHNIVINSYSDFDPGSKQYQWILKELESVVRALTPWLFVTFHVPMYNTFHYHENDIQLLKAKEHLESLFVKYKVNVVFSGHVHAYMRTHPVIRDKVNATGPVHIIVGDGGLKVEAPFKKAVPEDWVAMRDNTYNGYGTIEVLNRTHSLWEWVHSGRENKTNHVREHNKWEDVPSPSVEHDKAYILNQFFL